MSDSKSRFIQLHILTSYPAANLNRDDLGRPKTVTMGNVQRLRVSSQSLKRAWRTSDVFSAALGGNLGVRTKEIGKCVYRALVNGVTLDEAMRDPEATGALPKVKEASAFKIGRAIGSVFAKIKAEKKGDLDSLETEQMAHLTPTEIDNVAKLVEVCRENGKEPDSESLDLLRKENAAADVALFGRMLAASNRFNVEAAAQVAHAMTVHSSVVEDDFFTAVDDLNREDAGAGHMGVAEFGAGLFYLYLCVDRELLAANLGGDAELVGKALGALVEAACTVSPTGKQNSYASRAYASYCLAEKGDAHPRTLANAFLKPLDDDGYDLLDKAMEMLTAQRDDFARIYGSAPESVFFGPGAGTLADIRTFITE
ncbi:type I-E CRISPR-associated protein Cas7/Cse4/CasC [Pseudodesulfovibrio indicus]|uniref:type I-E CRISPR-associated protein Cas7/Cse4/CasC n=1 Tax=Pseudodesulfovibrio indicus TaxID=1716143 RepID=UPI00292FB9AD|nr:type I-E CRISPR-associated protein Cas7/Cse4/CasC [Pseudodesulfovibrio indicus]